MLYIVVLFYLVYLIWKYDIRKQKIGNLMHYNIVLLIFILVAGLSYRLGVDTIRYEFYFYDQFEYTWDGLFKHVFRSHGEPLFVLTNLLTKDFFGEFFVSRLVMSLFYHMVFFWFVRKHSPAPFTTILLYAVFQYFNFNFQVIRETMAVSFFLIGLDGLLQSKPKYIKYVCCIILAMGFHHFAFLALFFPFFFHLKPNKFYLIQLAVLFLVGSSLSIVIGEVASLEFINDSLSDKVEGYVESSRYGQRTISSIINWVVFFFGILIPSCIMVFQAKKADSRLVSLALFYIIITVLRYTSFGILFRINNYLFFIFAIVITQAFYDHDYCKGIGFRRNRYQNFRIKLCMWCITIMVAYRFAFLYVSGMTMYYPYSSVITHDLDEKRETLYYEMGINYKHD